MFCFNTSLWRKSWLHKAAGEWHHLNLDWLPINRLHCAVLPAKCPRKMNAENQLGRQPVMNSTCIEDYMSEITQPLSCVLLKTLQKWEQSLTQTVGNVRCLVVCDHFKRGKKQWLQVFKNIIETGGNSVFAFQQINPRLLLSISCSTRMYVTGNEP